MVFPEPSDSLNTFDYLSDISKRDCLIAISYPRYSKLTQLAAEMASRFDRHSDGSISAIRYTLIYQQCGFSDFFQLSDSCTFHCRTFVYLHQQKGR